MKENFFTRNINKLKTVVAGAGILAASHGSAQEAPKQAENLTDNKKIEASTVASNQITGNNYEMTADSFAKAVQTVQEKNDGIKFTPEEQAKIDAIIADTKKAYEESEERIKKIQEENLVRGNSKTKKGRSSSLHVKF